VCILDSFVSLSAFFAVVGSRQCALPQRPRHAIAWEVGNPTRQPGDVRNRQFPFFPHNPLFLPAMSAIDQTRASSSQVCPQSTEPPSPVWGRFEAKCVVPLCLERAVAPPCPLPSGLTLALPGPGSVAVDRRREK
jgi:hypothetical protein